jgi:hypothetical protein
VLFRSTADHIIVSEADKGLAGERSVVVIKDRATKWTSAYPVADKSAEEAVTAFTHFIGSRESVKLFHSDNSPELIKAAKDMGWPHSTATPGRPETNGVAERAVRAVLEASRSILFHAGLPPAWRPKALRYISVVRNTEGDKGETPWELRHGRKFAGLLIPFGAAVEFKTSPIRDGPGKFAPKATPGVFVGYYMQPGGQWKGDYLVARLEDFASSSGSLPRPVPVQRVKEVIQMQEITFPLKARYDAERYADPVGARPDKDDGSLAALWDPLPPAVEEPPIAEEDPPVLQVEPDAPPPPAAVNAAVVPQPMVAFAAEGAPKALIVIGTATG